MNDVWISWWAHFSEISVAAGICPASADGRTQTAAAVIASAGWQSAFAVAALITLALAVVLVLITYETRAMGDHFWKRWWIFLSISTIVSFGASFLWLTNVSVLTEGCEFGNVMTNIPTSFAASRAGVSAAQGVLLFVVLSWLLTLVARVSKRPTWYNNSRIPFRF